MAKEKENAGLVKFDESKLAKLNQVTTELEVAKTYDVMKQSCSKVAHRKILLEILDDNFMDVFVMPGMNTDSGFRTDKDPAQTNSKTGKPYEPYPAEVVRECVADAILYGLTWTNNQMNIISGRMYPTKNGYTYKLENEGVKSSIIAGIPRMKDGGALIDMTIEWLYKGQKGSKTLTFAIRVNAGMGVDAIVGKAKRKIKAWLWENLTGQDLGDVDVTEDIQTIDVTAETVKPSAQTAFEETLNV